MASSFIHQYHCIGMKAIKGYFRSSRMGFIIFYIQECEIIIFVNWK